ncbi:MAG: HDIG domain-containing protein [Bacteroidales bacterium]
MIIEKRKIAITRSNVWQALFFIAAVALTIIFIPRERQFRYYFDEGKPWRYGLLTAPFDFAVYKSDEVVKHEKDSVLKNFMPYFSVDNNIAKREAENFREESRSEAMPKYFSNAIITSLFKTYSSGIIDADNYEKLRREGIRHIRLLENGIAREYETDNLLTPKKAYEKVLSEIYNDNARKLLYEKNLNLYLVPNIRYDSLTSEKACKQLLERVSLTSGMIQSGERIIDRGVIVTPNIYKILKSYEKAAFKREGNIGRSGSVLTGQAFIVVILYSLFYIFMALFRRRIFHNTRKLGFLMMMITGVTLASYVMTQRWLLGIYIVPLAVLPIIVVTFMDARIALYCSIIAILLCAFSSPFPTEYILLQMVVCMTAIDSLKELVKRSQMLNSVLLIFIAYSATYIGYTLLSEGSWSKLNSDMFLYLTINCFMLLFTYLFVFVVEKIFGFTSNVMLVELSDINSPLLRELSEKCPGTFQHATQVANLGAEAANRIGAKALLVRTGALYHDIGKIANPIFFTENQHTFNPHTNLSCENSAKIIINHVEDGIDLAKRHNLPESIKGFIASHHGKSKAKYFYMSFKKEHPGEDIDETAFTYQGPKPYTKEEGILMLADVIEAKSRSMTDYSHDAISKMVNETVDEIVADGQLNNTSLSFRDVSEIREVFIERLKSIYHPRISYPESQNTLS